jgi:hypothetical protein
MLADRTLARGGNPVDHDETGAIDSPGPSNASALARALGASEADAVRVAIAEDLL